VIDVSSARTVGHAKVATASGTHTPVLLARRRFPALPIKPGSYSYGGVHATAGWTSVSSDTGPFVQVHFPHVEVLSGINPILSDGAAPIDVSIVSAYPLLGPGTDTDNIYGYEAHSIQDNAFFTGNNGHADAVQFTDQVHASTQAACITQVDTTTLIYNIQCANVSINPVQLVEGWAYNGELGVAVASRSGSKAVALEVPDEYGLGSDDRWTNSSGSILGLGHGSEAVFGDKTEESIAIEVGACLDDAGFIKFSVTCGADKLSHVTETGYSPGNPAGQTQETNNLIPVIGQPPTHLPTQEYFGNSVAQINEVATMSGNCLSGSPPYC
jgi:hypothetical protein